MEIAVGNNYATSPLLIKVIFRSFFGFGCKQMTIEEISASNSTITTQTNSIINTCTNIIKKDKKIQSFLANCFYK